ncbi:ABC transporter permease [Cohnella pontilimi]|uniref:ABC transporter permease n=1 Tax=Cohnella pontilimi TaxID=2564100 RepID=A0A4U0FC03_9BACL|nr:ABC transporter permease [Cohnella pontilimi]TJY42376.1 ABC transporter permease [Cohnella pontilimi]
MLAILESLPKAIEFGLLFAFLSLGVYITFRILDFPDLTVDGSFTTGGAIAAVMITHGYSPWLSTVAAFGGGCAAGAVTGLLHTKGRINGLLSGILMMIALYSINLRIMGVPNVSLLGEPTIFSSGVSPMLISAVGAVVVKLLIDLFFRTDLGLSLRATGDNARMIRSFGVNTDNSKMLGISLSNGLVAISGALFAQYGGFADNSQGIGMIVIGLASVIIGEAIFGTRTIFWATLAAVFGAVFYWIVYTVALESEWLRLEASDMKMITALIVIVALVIPTAQRALKQRSVARRRSAELAGMAADTEHGGGR